MNTSNIIKPSRSLSNLAEQQFSQIVRSESLDELHNQPDTFPSLFEMIFSEAAVSPSEAIMQTDAGLIKFDYHYGNFKLVMFSGKILEKKLKQKGVGKFKFEDVRDSIMATIGLDTYAPGLDRVGNVAAEKGYGPLIYDLALSLEKNWLCPDTRPRPMAQIVWKYYYENRPDVDKILIEDITQHKNHRQLNPDSPWLWYGYKIKKPVDGIDELFENGNKIKRLIKSGISQWSNTDQSAEENSSEYFKKRYKETKPRDEYDE